MAGISAMGDLSHELETLVLQIDSGAVAGDDHAHAVMQASLDELARMRDLVSAGTLPGAARALIAQIRDLRRSRERAAAAAAGAAAAAPPRRHRARRPRAPRRPRPRPQLRPPRRPAPHARSALTGRCAEASRKNRAVAASEDSPPAWN